MRRSLASLAAALALAAPAVRAGEPLDLDITRLGPPSAQVWASARCFPAACAPTTADEALAADARARFAMLGSELALALSSALLEPAATIGHAAFAFDVESAYTTVHHGAVGTEVFPAPPAAALYPRDAWPTRTTTPSALLVPSFHVRKSFPFSLELGGRILYLSQSSYFAAQLHGKWAIQEGYALIPDVALLVAHTIFLGQKYLDLSSTDLTLMTSRRFGVNAIMSLTPYLALRYLRVSASSGPIGYAPATAAPATVVNETAAFPSLSRSLYRTTLGVRMTAFATTMAAEATWFGGGHYPASGGYPDYRLQSSISGAFKLGFEF
jgi:hypothetical protein